MNAAKGPSQKLTVLLPLEKSRWLSYLSGLLGYVGRQLDLHALDALHCVLFFEKIEMTKKL